MDGSMFEEASEVNGKSHMSQKRETGNFLHFVMENSH